MKIVAAVTLTMVWLGVTALSVLVVMLMSLDEEWQGFWTDVGFNPHISLPYLVFTGMIGVPVFLLLRSLWNNHDGFRSWPTTWKW